MSGKNIEPKPSWLKIKLTTGEGFRTVADIVRSNNLHTVCNSARCPNKGECWEQRTATLMILGAICTRNCSFCAVAPGRPSDVDLDEPRRVALAVQKMGLRHVVLTSVTRDDLSDQGSQIWAETITAIRAKLTDCTIEVLIPDFKGDEDALQRVFTAVPNVLGHNLETVGRLYPRVRPGASIARSLNVLARARMSGLVTKTGIMVGLGETDDEIRDVMYQARRVGVAIFTVGQYLQPSKSHHKVDRYVTPSAFTELKRYGLSIGIPYVEAGPLVRSSYHAELQLRSITSHHVELLEKGL